MKLFGHPESVRTRTRVKSSLPLKNLECSSGADELRCDRIAAGGAGKGLTRAAKQLVY